MTIETQAYRYTESGLRNVWIEGLRIQDDAGEKTILIPNINELHKLIARQIVVSDGALTGAELRYLRTEMGMTQEELGGLVHRKRLTISRWERGESQLDRAAEALIRICAQIKLDLDDADPAEISGKCKSGTDGKAPIRIDGTDPENYRLAA